MGDLRPIYGYFHKENDDPTIKFGGTIFKQTNLCGNHSKHMYKIHQDSWRKVRTLLLGFPCFLSLADLFRVALEDSYDYMIRW